MKNFFVWHYSQGLRNFLATWKNYHKFFWNYFSIGRLFVTLFSPWRRDVSRVMREGFHPVLLLQAFFENVMTRIMGAIVKFFVIIFGLIFEFITLLAGAFFLIVWILFPIAFVFSFGELIFTFTSGFDLLTPLWVIVLVFSALAVIISLYAQKDKEDQYYSMSFFDLSGEKWFERVWNRLGKNSSEVNKNILQDQAALSEFLRPFNLTTDDFSRIVSLEMGLQLEKTRKSKFWLKENLDAIVPIGRHWAFAYTIHLDRYAKDLSLADFSEYHNARLIGKENELTELARLLIRPSQNNVILVGETGVGRETIIHTLAKEIRENKIGEPLTNKRILEFDLRSVLADHEGSDPDQVLGMFFAEAAYAGNIILVLKNIHEYLDHEGRDISPILSQYLMHPTFQVIGTTDPAEFHAKIEKKENIMKYCEKIIIEEMNQEDALEVMFYKLQELEKKRVVFTYPALQEVIKLSDRYVSGSPFPEKALDLMEEILLYWNNSSAEYFVTEAVVDEAVSAKIKVPLGKVDENESDKLMNLEAALHQRVIGQDFAIKQIAETMRRARIGMVKKDKPIGSFLFLGPTGVGKTESAKALAAAYFGEEDRMIRMDMSEYQLKDSIDRLIGSSATGEAGHLVNKVKESPFGLLLLDEIEKAHPDILDIFLQVLDEGHLTDAFGKKISFRNLIIIATSNAGSDIIKESIQKNLPPEEISKQVIDYAIRQNIFRPEFLNRFEGVVFFSPLSREEVFEVTRLQLSRYAEQLKEQENITVSFEDGVVEKIVERAFDPVFGARAIERYIQDKIGDAVVKKIISGELQKGTSFVFTNSEIE